MLSTKAYAAQTSESQLAQFQINRRDVRPDDVQITIDYCGVCHTDIHLARNDWGTSVYPVVPGHEIIGHVTQVGDNVDNIKVGDAVAVGCMVDACRTCSACTQHLEQYCERGFIATYNGEDAILGGKTFGGYSKDIIVDKHFVLHLPESLVNASAAPLLCAGITTYSPLKKWQIKPGDKVGVIGLGGLGHMGVKLAAAMGAEVIMITRSANKQQDAKRLGAHDVIVSTDEAQMNKHANSFDFLLNTIPRAHDVNPYLSLMKRDTTMVLVGAFDPLPPVMGGNLIRNRKRVAGSLIGGIAETQEMLNFCATHNITSDIEQIAMADINVAYERMLKSDVKYRFVIDMSTL
ncbi:MAG: NAD(P)-dependent alcohol dehydrogenase [Pseudomonadota bacterium]